MKYSNNALNVLVALSCNGIGNAWIVKNIVGNETDEEMVDKINKDIDLDKFSDKKDEIREKIESLGDCIDGCVAFGDKDFPKYRTEKIKDSDKPVFLTYKGDLDLLNTKHLKIAVIGLLKPSEDIVKLEKEIVHKMLQKEAVIISGLATGCDSIAHKATLEKDLTTVAILPSTLKNILPKENCELADEIVLRGGLLISEYYEDLDIRNKNDLSKLSNRYIQRDRLQALYSDAVCLAASYSSDTKTEVNGKEVKRDTGSRHALAKAGEWGITRLFMYGKGRVFEDEMFDLNRKILNEGGIEINLENADIVIGDIMQSKNNTKSLNKKPCEQKLCFD